MVSHTVKYARFVMCDAMCSAHVSVDADMGKMSLPATHFHRLTFSYLAVSLIFGGEPWRLCFFILTSLSHYCILIVNEWRALIFWCERSVKWVKKGTVNGYVKKKCVYQRVVKMGWYNDDDDNNNNDICSCSGATEPQWSFIEILFCLSAKHFSFVHFSW